MAQADVDAFYLQHGPCCAGCDWWQWHNAVAGQCTKAAPVAAEQRLAMLGFDWISVNIGSGHPFTARDHLCGDFKDTYNWPRNLRP